MSANETYALLNWEKDDFPPSNENSEIDIGKNTFKTTSNFNVYVDFIYKNRLLTAEIIAIFLQLLDANQKIDEGYNRKVYK